jgi:Ca2+-binding EF-hand superfamily protein
MHVNELILGTNCSMHRVTSFQWQFLALKRHELHKLKSVFQRSIDFDRGGKILAENYAMFLGEPLSMASFLRQIFALSSNGSIAIGKYSSSNSTPMIDVGSTLQSTAVFSMLFSTDRLKFIFAWYDEECYGYIDNADFKQLLASFHPRHSNELVT